MGKGGGQTTTTVDPTYNAGMLELSREQQDWGKQMFNMFKYGVTYDPTEKVTAEGEPSTERVWVEDEYVPGRLQYGDREGTCLPGYTVPGHYKNIDREPTTTLGEIRGYDPNETTSEMEYLQNLVEANQSLLGLKTETQRKMLESASMDPGKRMDEAQAEVQHGFKNARRGLRMDIGSYGLDPTSTRYKATNRGLALAEASGISAARSRAKNEQFERQARALQF